MKTKKIFLISVFLFSFLGCSLNNHPENEYCEDKLSLTVLDGYCSDLNNAIDNDSTTAANIHLNGKTISTLLIHNDSKNLYIKLESDKAIDCVVRCDEYYQIEENGELITYENQLTLDMISSTTNLSQTYTYNGHYNVKYFYINIGSSEDTDVKIYTFNN